MILANLARAVREQNYYAVALEFVIVIAGVVIGFQINAWNEARALKEAERATLVRLQAESEAVVLYWTALLSQSRSANERYRFVAHTLGTGQLDDENRSRYVAGLSTLSRFPALNPPSVVQDELIASGALANISDLAAREAVSEYVRSVEFGAGQLESFRSSTSRFWDAAQAEHMSLDYDPASPTLSSARISFEAQLADPEFRSAVFSTVAQQNAFHLYRRAFLSAAVNMCRAVSSALDQPCVSAEAAQEELNIQDWDDAP